MPGLVASGTHCTLHMVSTLKGLGENFPWKVKAKLVKELVTCIKGC